MWRIIAIYLVFILPVLIIVIPRLFLFVKDIVNQLKIVVLKYSDRPPSEIPMEEVKAVFTAVRFSAKREPELSELQKQKLYGSAAFRRFFAIFFVLARFPPFALRMAIASRFGIVVLWKVPFTFYDIWDLLFLWASFDLSTSHRFIAAGFCSFSTLITNLDAIFSDLKIENGYFKGSIRPKHKTSLVELLRGMLIVTLSFASIYYMIGQMDPIAFSTGTLSIFESIYFSIVTAATVGFGDISPLSVAARSACIIQIVYSFVFVCFVVGVHLASWIKHYSPVGQNSDKQINDGRSSNVDP